jgi:hypothetical protein
MIFLQEPKKDCSMNATTYPGIVENGQIRLDNNVRLPEKTAVFVVVPSDEPVAATRIASPRLARPEQTVDFVKVVVQESPNAGV